MPNLKSFFKRYWPFFLFVVLSLAIRFINYKQLLLFTWDQGRDYFAVQKIVNGDLTLIGPTTGLQGFFLGPLWYYLGVIGYIIGGGSPFIFSLFYSIIACLAVPAYWIFSQQLFKDKKFSSLLAVLLSAAYSSVLATTRVWNPMISVVLMIVSYLLLVKARSSRLMLWLGFFSLGLVLQSEFAYGIFFAATLFVLIFWIRKRFNWLDYLAAASAVGLTFVPQLLFELRNQFIMSKSLVCALINPQQLNCVSQPEQINWSIFLSRRPFALLRTTKHLMTDFSDASWPVFLIMLLLVILGLKLIPKRRQDINHDSFKWQLLALFAVIPYPFFLFWKGNQGYFFEYYLTPHFVFLLPLFVLGVKWLIKQHRIKSCYACVLLGMVLFIYQANLYHRFFNPVNNAGYNTMNRAISQIYTWMNTDQVSPGVIRVFTPNAETEHYDALIHWQAKQEQQPIPYTVRDSDDRNWYILIEPDYQTEKRLNKWYRQATDSGRLTRRRKIGDLTVESWQKK